MKIKLSATVPVVQYGNLMPEIEVEAETYEQAMAEAEGYIKAFWNKYVEAGKELAGDTANRLTDMFGNEIDYDPLAHVYSWNGQVYLSGSGYAETFKQPFDKLKIAGAMAKKIGAKPEEVLSMWDLKSRASRNFGSALHEALELYERFNGLAKLLDKTTHLHDNPVLKTAVEGFYATHKDETARSEVLVVDHATKRAGQIDRLLVTGDKTCIVADFKTDLDIEKNIPVHQRQLSFYAAIMQANGWTVQGLRLHHYDGAKWVDHDMEVLPV